MPMLGIEISDIEEIEISINWSKMINYFGVSFQF